MMCCNVVVGKIPHKERCLAINVVNAVENIPNGLLVMLKGRIEKVCSITFEISGSTLPYLKRKICLDIAEQLFRICDGRIFEAKVPFIVEHLSKF